MSTTPIAVPTLWGVTYRAVVVHTLTYLLVGALAFALFDYPALFAEPGLRELFRQTDDPMVMAGPLFQPLRGALFGLVFYLLRESFFTHERGWVTMWIMLVVVGILSTFGPALGSIEGLIYTRVPARFQLGWGMLEVLSQSLLLSVGVWYWVRHAEQRRLTVALSVLFVIGLLLPTLGLLLS